MPDYFSFEEVMRELELSEEELKRMVSEGELRAFRDENKMKFKKDDVTNLKKGRITEPTIILPSTPGAGQDDSVLDLDVDQKQPAAPPGDSGFDELSIQSRDEESSDVGIEGMEMPTDEEIGQETEPLRLADEVDVAEEVVEETETEEVAEAEPQAAPKLRRGRASRLRRAVAAVPVSTEEEIERRRPSVLWTLLILVAFISTTYSSLFVYDLMRIESGAAEQPMGLTAGTADWILNQFWGDKEWRKFHEREFLGGLPPYSGFSTPEKPHFEIKHRAYSGPTWREPDVPPPTFETP
ncbi:MAG: hypothetical protein HY716_15140 [Planctomycetes bacterium]|nr:hypothetical protein [Planctomycetota bacterium]